ncbi:isopenicillin N synthase family dioxygenase [Spiribacter salinus]|uniref:isopenicillin N synthase family dioxygenase n=1 Tax=Spiribacter salinus TaxID=1335746 RepID=UPI001C96C837|nr:2-oxoglutarate and iron-dependent oxygenase domain-containing protein [Spiribacter salinus]MBY5268248.1 oxidoreductase [Spiribacter salinus]
MIPRIDFARLAIGDPDTIDAVAAGARDIGFLTLENTPITQVQQASVMDTYRAFFHQSPALKAEVDMAKTGSNRGWGAPQSEQVDPGANPDYKEVFDCGIPLPPDDPLADLPVYAPNLWPESPAHFRSIIEGYFEQARAVSMTMLRGIALGIGEDPGYFADQFDRPMALLRGNYYPPRPDWAGEKDFGIAAHTDYGCLTLLASDGRSGLEVELRDGTWHSVALEPGVFVINFGEMLEMWSAGVIKATPHRVIGGSEERISAPLFFNPDHEANVAPAGSSDIISAGAHLRQRYAETYLHMKTG